MSKAKRKKEKNTATCEWCGAVIPQGEEEEGGDGEVICLDCFENQGTCDVCHGSGGGLPPFQCSACHGTGNIGHTEKGEEPEDRDDE